MFKNSNAALNELLMDSTHGGYIMHCGIVFDRMLLSNVGNQFFLVFRPFAVHQVQFEYALTRRNGPVQVHFYPAR